MQETGVAYASKDSKSIICGLTLSSGSYRINIQIRLAQIEEIRED